MTMATFRRDGERRALRFERVLAAAPDDVWSALTEPDRLKRWLAEATFEPRVGGRVELRFDDGRMEGVVRELDPPRVLEYEWEEGKGASVVRFELTPTDEGTRLVLDHRELPAESAAGFGAGWHAHLDSLAETLGASGGAKWRERFQSLLPAYQERAAAV